MTTLNERPIEVGGLKQAARGKRFLVIAVVLLVVALVGLGIRAISDQGTSLADEEIEQLFEDYLTAWETKDAAALRSVTTEDFVINEYIYTDEYVYSDDVDEFRLIRHINDDVDGVVILGFLTNWSTEQLGDRIVTGDGPWFVSVEEIWEEPPYILEGQANYTIVEVDGTLKIANHYWAGLSTYQAD